MPARTPEDAHRLWAEAYLAGDLETLVELYAPEATWMPAGERGHRNGGDP